MRTSLIYTLILDLDGPILDGKLRHYQCYCDILTKYNLEPAPIDVYWEMKRQRKDRHTLLAASGADRINEAFKSIWLEKIEQKEYLSLDRLQPGVLTKLQDWQTSGINIVLITLRNNHEHLYWQLDTMNLTLLFDTILLAEATQGSKGKAEKIRPLIEHIDKKSSLWIGDTEMDCEAARRLGIGICLVGNGLRTPDYLATLSPDFLLSGLDAANLVEMGLA